VKSFNNSYNKKVPSRSNPVPWKSYITQFSYN